MERERWRPVIGYEKYYMVSTWGRIKSIRVGFNRLPVGSIVSLRIKKSRIYDKGYWSVRLSGSTTRGTHTVHRLEASVFVPNPYNKPCINHKDCDTLNNYYKNLEWCTVAENNAHARRNNLINTPKGEDSSQAKITNLIALEIFQSTKTHLELAKIYKINPSTVGFIKVGKAWSHITGKQYVRSRKLNN